MRDCAFLTSHDSTQPIPSQRTPPHLPRRAPPRRPAPPTPTQLTPPYYATLCPRPPHPTAPPPMPPYCTPPIQVQPLCIPDTPLEGLSSPHGPANDHDQLLDAKPLCHKSILGLHIVLNSDLHHNHALTERGACAAERGGGGRSQSPIRCLHQKVRGTRGEGRVIDTIILC